MLIYHTILLYKASHKIATEYLLHVLNGAAAQPISKSSNTGYACKAVQSFLISA